MADVSNPFARDLITQNVVFFYGFGLNDFARVHADLLDLVKSLAVYDLSKARIRDFTLLKEILGDNHLA